MNRASRVVSILIAAATLAGASLARADEATDLEKGTSSYDAGRYDEGAERFRQMLDPSKPGALKAPDRVQRARAYYAACLIALGRIDEAKQQIEQIYRHNPIFVPDAVVFPGRVVDLFADAREKMKEEILKVEHLRREDEERQKREQEKAREQQRAYLAALRELAADQSEIVRHSRWIAAVPFGVGQFQNGQDNLGYAFLVSEIVTAGISLGSTAVVLALAADGSAHLEDSANEPRVDWNDLNDRLRSAKTLNLYSTIAFAALAVGGVLQAQWAYVPEVREKKIRTIPAPPPSVAPNVSFVTSGVTVGLGGHF